MARFSAGIWDPRGYINQPALAGSQLVPGGWTRNLPGHNRLQPGPGLAIRTGTTRPGARAYTTITATRSYVPRSQRLQVAAGAPRLLPRSSGPVAPCGPGSASVSESPLRLTASHPRDGAGNAFAASAAPVWRNPPPTPTPALGTPSRVPPDFGSVPSAQFPLRPLDSAQLRSARRRCLPNRLARSRRVTRTRQNRSWTSIRRTQVLLAPSRPSHRPAS